MLKESSVLTESVSFAIQLLAGVTIVVALTFVLQ